MLRFACKGALKTTALQFVGRQIVFLWWEKQFGKRRGKLPNDSIIENSKAKMCKWEQRRGQGMHVTERAAEMRALKIGRI